MGILVFSSEVQATRGTQAIAARVIGFSTGKRNRPTSPSFHSVAEYVGLDVRKYYVEAAYRGYEKSLSYRPHFVAAWVRTYVFELSLLRENAGLSWKSESCCGTGRRSQT